MVVMTFVWNPPANTGFPSSMYSNRKYLNAAIQTLDEKLDQMAAPYAADMRLFCTIPGMGCESALTILSEIGTDMTQFGSSKGLCS